MHAQPEPTDRAEVHKLAQAVEAVLAAEMAKTSYRDDTPLPTIGSTPPVAQPGIPPMGQQATDIGRAAMYCGLATVPPGLIAIGVIVASEHANPTVIGMICAAPAALAIPILAVAGLLRRAKEVVEVAPPTVHNYYSGPVTQDSRSITTSTRGVIANTRNQTSG